MYFSSAKTSTTDLEEELTNRLKEDGSEITSRTIKHASKTFDEIISKDVHFGTLLRKIKKAYDTYIRSKFGDFKIEKNLSNYEDLDMKL